MIETVVTEIELPGCKPLRRIWLDIDGGKGFCYRGRVSFDAFFHSRHKRNYRKDPRRLYVQKSKEEHELDQGIWKRSLKKAGLGALPEVPEVKVESVWALYKLIGYNYQKKRFE